MIWVSIPSQAHLIITSQMVMQRMYVQLAKMLLFKAKELGEDPCLALILYKTSPLGHDLLSSMEINVCQKRQI